MDTTDALTGVRLSIGAGVIVLVILGILLLGWQRVDASDCVASRAAACDPVGVPATVPQA